MVFGKLFGSLTVIDIFTMCILLFVFITFLSFIFIKNLSIFMKERSRIFKDLVIKHTTFLTIIFLIIFTLEQIILIFMVNEFKTNVNILQICISIFALWVVTTAYFQKSISDIREEHYKEQLKAVSDDFESKEELLDVIDEQEKLLLKREKEIDILKNKLNKKKRL